MPPQKAITIKMNPAPESALVALKGKRSVSIPARVGLVASRLKKVGELSPSGHPITLTQTLVIKKGDLVPAAFAGISGIKVAANGLATASYTDTWCQSNWQNNSDWSNNWGECWDNSVANANWSGLVVNTAVTGVKAFTFNEFNARELKALAKFNLVR